MKTLLIGAALACAAAALPVRAEEPSLDAVRAATQRFQDVKVALAEGYVRDPGNMCETADMMGRPAALGAMGVHYFRPDLLGITAPPNPRVDGNGTHVDFLKPGILIYEPQADGAMKLVAVENLPDIFRTLGNVAMDVAVTGAVGSSQAQEEAIESA